MVFVVLLLDNADHVFELLLVLACVPSAAAVSDNGCGKVAEDPRAGGLNCVDEGGGEEELANSIPCGFVVEEGEECPVDEPSAVGELRQRVVEELGIDRFLHFLHLLHSRLPVRSQDFRSQLSPCRGRDLVVVGGENSELVKQFSCCLIVSAAVLEVAKVIQDINHLDSNLFSHQ
jgi:hypothetical protein